MLHTALELGISLTQIDERGRYPIHVACAHGASSRFIALCIRSNPSSAGVKDIDDNTPLQLLCKGTWKGDWNLKLNPSAEQDIFDILEILYIKAPAHSYFHRIQLTAFIAKWGEYMNHNGLSVERSGKEFFHSGTGMTAFVILACSTRSLQ